MGRENGKAVERAELVKSVEQYLEKAGSGEVAQVRLSVGPAKWSVAQVRSALDGLVKAGKARFWISPGWKSGNATQTRSGREESWWVDGYKGFTTYVRLAEAA